MLARKHERPALRCAWDRLQLGKFEAFVKWFNVGAALYHEECGVQEWQDMQKQVYEGICWKNFGNLPKNSAVLFTGCLTYDAWQARSKVTCEHRYPKTPWFRCLLKLYGPENPMTVETFLWLYENDGGTYHKTTRLENDRLRTPQRRDPLDGGDSSYAQAGVLVKSRDEWHAVDALLLANTFRQKKVAKKKKKKKKKKKVAATQEVS